MKFLVDCLLMLLLISYVWLNRNDSRAFLGGAAYFVAAGLVGALARQLRDLANGSESAKAASVLFAIAYLLALLSFLNSSRLKGNNEAWLLAAATALMYSGVPFWLVSKTKVEGASSKSLPPLFVYTILFLSSAVLIPFTLLAGSTQLNVFPDIVQPQAISLLFAALCSGSLGFSMFRRSLLASLNDKTRARILTSFAGILGFAALLQALTQWHWYSLLLSSVVLLGLAACTMRLLEENIRPGGEPSMEQGRTEGSASPSEY